MNKRCVGWGRGGVRYFLGLWNNFLLKHARDVIFSLQVVNMMETRNYYEEFWNVENFQNGTRFCPIWYPYPLNRQILKFGPRHPIFLKIVKISKCSKVPYQYVSNEPSITCQPWFKLKLLRFLWFSLFEAEKAADFLYLDVFLNKFLLKHARDVIFSLQVVNMMETRNYYEEFWNVENFQNGTRFLSNLITLAP